MLSDPWREADEIRRSYGCNLSLPNCQVSTRVLFLVDKIMCLTVRRLYSEQNLGEEVFGRLKNNWMIF